MSKVCLIKSNEIVNGEHMMYHNTNLNTWDSDLELLEEAYGMFASCYNLSAFSAKTPKLTNGKRMFYEVGVPSWANGDVRTIKMDFDSLSNGYEMFANCGKIELVSRTPLNYHFEFPSLTQGCRMFCNTLSVGVRSENDTECVQIDYLRFPSLIDATEMFVGANKTQNNHISFTNSDMFPVATNFEKTFYTAKIASFDLELLTGKQWNSGMPPIELNCRNMFYSASVSDYVYVGLPSSLENSDIRIYADGMFAGCTGMCRAKESFMNKLVSANYMFLGADLRNGGLQEWDGCEVLNAKGMFMNAELDWIFQDVTMGSVTEIMNFMRGSDVGVVENFYVNSLGGGMFRDCYNLTGAYIRIGSSQSPNADSMFMDCGELRNVKLEFTLTTPHCQNFSNMFSGCKYLETAEFVGNNGELNFHYLTLSSNMFSGCERLRSYDIVSACASMSYLTDTSSMFMGTQLSEWPFFNNRFGGNLPDLRYGHYMASGCSSMVLNFDDFGDNYFGNLENGSQMFLNATNATGRWKTNLPELVYGDCMFYGTGITSVYNPFVNSDVRNLGNELDFNELYNAYSMFANCANLAWCYMNVASLEVAEGMFKNTSGLRFARLVGCTNMYSALAMFENSNVEHVRLHTSGITYEKMWNCSSMFTTNGNLTVEITSDSTGSIDFFNQCSSAYMMFAVNGWSIYNADIVDSFKMLKVKGDIFTQGTPPISGATDMFNGRKIIDQQTASFIGGISHYLAIPSNQTADLGYVYIEDHNNLSWFDVWYTWQRGTEYECVYSSASCMYQTLSSTCRTGGNVTMTVFYPTPELGSPYDIVEGSAYIPDASSWNADFTSSGLVVTSVHDGYAWTEV